MMKSGVAFKTTFNEIQQQKEMSLRVVLEFEQQARELATLPWEYLYSPDTDRERGFFIATRNKLILTRQMPLNVAFDVLTPDEKPLRLLIAVSKPGGMTIVNAEPVVESIEELKEKMPDSIRIERLNQPTKRSFMDQVRDFRPHVVHFIGHGAYDTQEGTSCFCKR